MIILAFYLLFEGGARLRHLRLRVVQVRNKGGEGRL